VHGKAGRTTTRIFGVVVLADKSICSKTAQPHFAQPSVLSIQALKSDRNILNYLALNAIIKP
jgi:hypothetical protein